jgi:hypothetical protein
MTMTTDTTLAARWLPIVTGGWYCQVPTPGRLARVHVTAFEDGSARVVALDPDAEITGGK